MDAQNKDNISQIVAGNHVWLVCFRQEEYVQIPTHALKGKWWVFPYPQFLFSHFSLARVKIILDVDDRNVFGMAKQIERARILVSGLCAVILL